MPHTVTEVVPINIPKQPILKNQPNIGFIRQELEENLQKYQLVHDVVTEEGVKDKGVLYLPKPNADDLSARNQARYDEYVQRAIFYYFAKKTRDGLVGEMFTNDPEFEDNPDELQPVLDNVGNGNDITQLAKFVSDLTVSFGRCGIWTDHPITDGETTVDQINEGEVRSTINVYGPQNIINWRDENINGKAVLTMVMLKEQFISEDDGYALNYADQWRELFLFDNSEDNQQSIPLYRQRLWRLDDNGRYFQVGEDIIPTDQSGSTLQEIPFTFVGSRNNDSSIDPIVLYDLSTINIGHYINSADYEDSVHMVGQPTPFFTGLTSDWVKNVLGDRIVLGSRSSVPLPVGASAGLLQAEPNTMCFEAMSHKENVMVALGAKIVQKQDVARTATEVRDTSVSEDSILESIAKNVGDAVEFSLRKALAFISDKDEDTVTFTLKNNLNIANLTTPERERIIAEWQAGAVTLNEMRTYLRKGGIAFDDETEGEVRLELEKKLEDNKQEEKVVPNENASND